MDVLIITERVADAPWHEGAVPSSLARALAAGGDAVTLACESCQSPGLLESAGVRVRARSPFCPRGRTVAGAFARWGARVRDRHDGPVLSLTRLVGSECWCPVHARALGYLGAVLRRATLHERAAMIKNAPGSALGRLWPELRAPARRWRAMALPIAAQWACPGEAERSALRLSARSLLVIDPRERVVLLSAHEGLVREVLDVLEASGRLGFQSPVLVVPTSDSMSLHEAATRRGARVVLCGLTARFDALLACADAVGVPAGERGTPGRLVGDALHWGLPLLVQRGVRVPGEVPITRVRGDAGSWQAALAQVRPANNASRDERYAPSRLVEFVRAALARDERYHPP